MSAARYVMLTGRYPNGPTDTWYGCGGLEVVASSDYGALLAERDALLERIKCAEMSLESWDDGMSSEYWERYGERKRI